MSNKVRIGIIICNRYRTCAGGTCLRAMRNKEGAFSKYEAECQVLCKFSGWLAI
jgi:hypothetical protein